MATAAGGVSVTPTDKEPITPIPSANPNAGAGTSATPSLQSLQTQNPGANTFGASASGTAANVGTATSAAASPVGTIAGIGNGQINPNDATNAASQLDAITNSNSPYIQQAEQQGMLSAAARGLENSSLGAGASEAAAVQAAAPLAEQNASGATTGQLQNSQLQTQASEFNASQQNANQQLQAQLSTQQGQFNASQQQAADAANASAQNAMKAQVMQLDEQINQQYLSGSQAQSLASIQGQYNELIASNSSASSMFTSMMNGISATMANQNIAPQRAAATIQADMSLMESGLGIINALNGGSTNASIDTSGTTAAQFQETSPGGVPLYPSPSARPTPKP